MDGESILDSAGHDRYDGGPFVLVLEGEFNKGLAAKALKDTEDFTVLELDSWFDRGAPDVTQGSSRWEVHNSAWLSGLGGKVTPAHRHFGVQTHDDVST
jgi:hypothetical protein